MNTDGRRLWNHAAGCLAGAVMLGMACNTTVMASGSVLDNAAAVMHVYEKADESSPILMSVPETQAALQERQGRWIRIQVGDISGWVMADGIQKEDAADRTQTAEAGRDQEDAQDACGEWQRKATDAASETGGQGQIKADGEQQAKAQALAEQQAAAEAQALAEQQAAAKAQAFAEQQAAAKAQALAEQQAAAEAQAQALAEQQARAIAEAQAAVAAQKGITSQEMEILAALIQCEAGGESYVGQVAVGNVVMNRMESGIYPDTVTGVIYDEGQFTPVQNGRLSRTLRSGRISPSCRRAALEAVAGSEPVGDKLYFRRVNGRSGQVIGNHVFY